MAVICAQCGYYILHTGVVYSSLCTPGQSYSHGNFANTFTTEEGAGEHTMFTGSGQEHSDRLSPTLASSDDTGSTDSGESYISKYK